MVPPTPTKQLLPLSETDGLTSGAVQPPGSTGEEGKTEHTHVVSESGEESDGSYSDDDLMLAGEDDEERLIRQGGAGIPTGPVRALLLLCPGVVLTMYLAHTSGRQAPATSPSNISKICREKVPRS